MAGEEAGSGREKKWRPGGRSGGQVGEAAASPPLDPVGGEAAPAAAGGPSSPPPYGIGSKGV